ncbi:TIGR04002 family protein [Butyrivibrio sp. FCS014]|uniref:TIGR04002 family protein n=1 Tax=Butyrivibrio sp. FCS014 TaxID=1408304 RepID=UPI0004657363|nr:TIGR04002 family protein [Butyrivibrio sp. FCS014]
MIGKKSKIYTLTLSGVFAALITIFTAYIGHIPVGVNGGYIHFGDGLIYLAATILPLPYAMLAGAIGGGLADLLTAPAWTLATVIIKALIVIPFSNKTLRIVSKRNIAAPVIAYFISATGYYIAEALLFGAKAAIFTSFTGSFVQSLGSMIFFLMLGTTLDKLGFKARMEA